VKWAPQILPWLAIAICNTCFVSIFMYRLYRRRRHDDTRNRFTWLMPSVRCDQGMNARPDRTISVVVGIVTRLSWIDADICICQEQRTGRDHQGRLSAEQLHWVRQIHIALQSHMGPRYPLGIQASIIGIVAGPSYALMARWMELHAEVLR
jgi:hypothetical protein